MRRTICTALVVLALSTPVTAASDPVVPMTLTLVAASTYLPPSQTVDFGGALTASATGRRLAGQPVGFLVDGSETPTEVTATGADGSYSRSLTFAELDPHTVQAVAFYGTPQEVRSPPIRVSPNTTARPAGGAVVAAGLNHSCAIVADGSVRCWGDNFAGQLGAEGADDGSPVTVPGVAGAVSIAAGNHHTCVVMSSGLVLCWGDNYKGQVGQDPDEVRWQRTPHVVPGITDAVAVTAGIVHTCVLVASGQVRCLGSNFRFQLGAPTDDRAEPVTVDGLPHAVGVSAGDWHTCALVSGGQVMCWGDNAGGRLGDGTGQSRYWPTPVTGLRAVTAVEAGSEHTCALTAAGEAWCWGANDYGQLGDGVPAGGSALPARLVHLDGAVSINAGFWHTCAVLRDGGVGCLGHNGFGQLGDGTFESRSTPVRPVGLARAAFVVAGLIHSCAVLTRGGVRCWGSNSLGQLGNGITTGRSWALPVHSVTATAAISAGRDHTCTAGLNGSLRCWGENSSGQAGSGMIGDPHATPGDVVLWTVEAVAAGGSHTCAINWDGLSCWGDDSSGQLGDGTSGDSRPTPVGVAGVDGVVSVAAGSAHTCAVLDAGTVACWGDNSAGQLGDGTVESRAVAGDVEDLSGAVSVTAGRSHSCALVTGGTVWCWGANWAGQLGDGTFDDRHTPAPVVGIVDAVSVSAGDRHTCALLSIGTVHCWGENWYGQTGRTAMWSPPADDLRVSIPPTARDAESLPVPVDGVADATALSAGGRFTCAVSRGVPWCWGFNRHGQTGSRRLASNPQASRVRGVTGALAIEAGGDHACAVLTDGKTVCWGANLSGQLGDGTRTSVLGFQAPVETLTFHDRSGGVGLSAGSASACGPLSDGLVLCWGDNTSGQLGFGETSGESTLHPVPAAAIGVQAVAVASGRAHTCFLAGGRASCAGDNASGQLGDGTNVSSSGHGPVDVVDLAPAVGIAAGGAHTCAVTVAGHVWCWGSNAHGQLGDGTLVSSLKPVKVPGLVEVKAIAAGRDHTCAVLGDDRLSCWGSNSSGQLGDGTEETRRLTPGAVVGLSGVKALSAGGHHTCALLSAGSVSCFGDNSYGQLGPDGTEPEHNEPVNVSGTGLVSGISAGSSHTCVVQSDGRAACFGRGDSGQLGDGSTRLRQPSPVAVSGLTRVVAISAGGSHTCALQADGTAMCWGANNAGQLGDGTFARRVEPVRVVQFPP